MNTDDETIAAQLERIEAKLDLVLEKLEWSPRSEAQWYAGMQESKQETPTDGGI